KSFPTPPVPAVHVTVAPPAPSVNWEEGDTVPPPSMTANPTVIPALGAPVAFVTRICTEIAWPGAVVTGTESRSARSAGAGGTTGSVGSSTCSACPHAEASPAKVHVAANAMATRQDRDNEEYPITNEAYRLLDKVARI